MSDYSFMKSGLGNSSDYKPSLNIYDIENIEILLSLFISNAINDGWEPNKNLFNIDEATHKVNLQSIFLYFIIIYRDIIKIE